MFHEDTLVTDYLMLPSPHTHARRSASELAIFMPTTVVACNKWVGLHRTFGPMVVQTGHRNNYRDRDLSSVCPIGASATSWDDCSRYHRACRRTRRCCVRLHQTMPRYAAGSSSQAGTRWIPRYSAAVGTVGVVAVLECRRTLLWGSVRVYRYPPPSWR